MIPLAAVLLLLAGGLWVRGTLGASAPAVSGTSAGPLAPNISSPTVNGPHFSLAAQRGHPVVLYFMAAWCTSCLAESNTLGAIQHRYGDRVRIVLVDVDGKTDSPGALRDFVQRSQGPSRYWVLDSQGTIASAYHVTSLDTTYVINKQGQIAYSSLNPLSFHTLDRIVGQLV